MEAILHYIYDPLCGWCYAAESLTEAASRLAPGRYTIKLHAGGLFSRTRLPDAKRSHIRVADARIGELTGQIFGKPYLNGLLNDPNTVYDSSMPIRGILAAEAVQSRYGLPMLKALQRTHYRSGRRIVELPTIVSVAESIGLDVAGFSTAFGRVTNDELQKHLDSTRRLMYKVGAPGYPTFVAQAGDRFEVLPHERFYGHSEGFAHLINSILAPEGTATHSRENVPSSTCELGRCNGDRCSI